MKYYKMLFSPTGGTEKAADMLWSGFGETAEKIDITDFVKDYAEYRFEKEDVCLVAVPSYGGRVPHVAAERIGRMKGNGARAVLLVVYGNREYEDTMLELYEILAEAGFVPAAGVAAVAEHSIMRQFAAGRPDDRDALELKTFGKTIHRELERGYVLPKEHVPGNYPYREYGGVPMKPETGRACTGCGICASLCPVGAIPKGNPKDTDKEQCISCMRCISVCPSHARRVSRVFLFMGEKKLKKACSEYKKNELIL